MRRLSLIIAILTVFLCGYRTSGAASDYKDIMTKMQEIAVVSADTSEVMDVITEKEEIEAFVTALALEKWTLEELPESAKKIGSFSLSQEATIKLGQRKTDGILYDVCNIILYDNTHIDFEIAGVTMTFKISEEAENYLNEFF